MQNTAKRDWLIEAYNLVGNKYVRAFQYKLTGLDDDEAHKIAEHKCRNYPEWNIRQI